MEHEIVQTGEIHVPHNWKFSTKAEMEAAEITDISELDKIALLSSNLYKDNSYWILTSVNPVVWRPISGVAGEDFKINATGLLAELSDYDNEKEGFTFLATDTNQLFVKNSDAPGDWSNPIEFGKGEGVPQGGLTGQVLKKIDEEDFNTEWGNLNKSEVGLGDVDNTSDLDKPVSTLTQQAIIDLESSVNTELGNKVDKVAGKGLSDNNYDNTSKSKVDNISITEPIDLDDVETRLNLLDTAVVLKGGWNPTDGEFPGGGLAKIGWSYLVVEDGTVDGISFNRNDRLLAISDNASTAEFEGYWFKADYTDQVVSVFGRIGAIAAQNGDYNTDQVTEGTANLYHTAARVRDVVLAGFVAGSYSAITNADSILQAFQKVQARFNQLGTAADATLTTSTYDTTVGRVLRVGDGGLVGNAIPISDWDDAITNGAIYKGEEWTPNSPDSDPYVGTVYVQSNGYIQQHLFSVLTTKEYVRTCIGGQWTPYVVSITSGNIATNSVVAGKYDKTGGAITGRALTIPSLPEYTATPTLDCTTSNSFEFDVLIGDIDITLTNPLAGQTIQIRFQQDDVGGRAISIPVTAIVSGEPNLEPNGVCWLIMTYSQRATRWEGNWMEVGS